MSVGSAAGIVGQDIQGWASVLDKWAMQDAYANQIGLQQGYSNQALGNFNTNLPQFGADAARQQIGTGATDRLAQYQKTQQVPLSPTGQKTSGMVPASLNVTNRAAANYGGYGNWLFNEGQNQIGQQRLLNQIVSFAKGQANVFPYTMYEAQHSMDALTDFGKAISSLGGSGGAPASSGSPFGGSSQQSNGNDFGVMYNSGTQAGTDYIIPSY